MRGVGLAAESYALEQSAHHANGSRMPRLIVPDISLKAYLRARLTYIKAPQSGFPG